MKLNLWKRWKERRDQKRKLREQKDLLQTWTWLESIFKSGMLSFDNKLHRLFIMQPFASLLMARGAEGWLNSIHAIYQYIYWRQTQQAWEKYMQKEEMDAVRKAINGMDASQLTVQNSQLKINNDDIQRIKRTRRAEIAMSDMEPPKVEPFEFFIIPDSTEAKVEPIAVGHYDPNTEQMEVATWDEVKQLLQTAQEGKS